ncbi:MAG TPA: regulatory protein RecX [Chitinophagaceae bacterium]|nr:regulatory protein RecX [Chitinophagaceae bacterium]
MIKNKAITPEAIYLKAKYYCNYQERSHYETREKLYSLGLHKADVEAMLARLITEGYLDEERFACSFARGRFGLKGWGRIKIKYALKQKKVSEYSIKTALKQINDNEYFTALKRLGDDKWAALKNEQFLTRQAKTSGYLLQKGYELHLVRDVIKSLAQK